jgi:hypothetical protein
MAHRQLGASGLAAVQHGVYATQQWWCQEKNGAVQQNLRRVDPDSFTGCIHKPLTLRKCR